MAPGTVIFDRPGPRRIAVLGGTGFVGRRLVAHLAAQGHQLRVPARDPLAARALRVLPNVRLIGTDVHDAGALAACLRGCDAVVNLIGILNEAGDDGRGFARAHVELMRTLLESCAAESVQRVVQVSALQADARYGASHYLRTKGEAEELLMATSSRIDWTILQPSVLFGPGDGFVNRFAKLLRLIPLCFPLARPQAQFAPVHVDDVVAAIDLALTHAETHDRCYQLCGPDVYSLRALVRMIGAASGHRRAVIGLPDWLARLQARAMELLPGKPFSMDNYRSLTVPSVCTRDGFAELGLQPRPLAPNLPAALGTRAH